MALLARGTAPEHISTERIPTLMKLYGLMTKDVMHNVPRMLSPQTTWTDIAGSKDALSRAKDHLELVRERNRILAQAGDPPRSSIHILGSQPHAFTERSTMIANMIGDTLQSAKNRRGRIDKTNDHGVLLNGPLGRHRQPFLGKHTRR